MTIVTDFKVRDNSKTPIGVVIRQHNKNFKELKKQDQNAKRKGQLIGRYIKEPFADGYAFYIIMKENKKTVKIRQVTGIGDDWQIPYWGYETIINKDYAIKSIKNQDAISKLFENTEEE